jgi:AbrB family looped-hinge helix DNA binding protein
VPTLAKKTKDGAASVLVLPAGAHPAMSSIRKERHTRIDKKGRIVIPASFRRALGVKSSEVVVLRPENDQLRVNTLRHRLVRAQKLVGEHVAPTVSLVDERIAERREDARRESDRHR